MRDKNGMRSRQVLRALHYCFGGADSAADAERRSEPPPVPVDPTSPPLRLLVVEDNPGDAYLVRRYLASATGASGTRVECTEASTLRAACEKLGGASFDAVLLDLGLPDARGVTIVNTVHDTAPSTPILVVSGEGDEATAVEAVRCGAQDYLVKSRFDGHALMRSIRYAIERLRNEMRLSQLAHFDDLTGLANRLLFSDRVAHALDRATRDKTKVALMFLDLDHFKAVNDGLGHAMGDKLLQLVAARIEGVLRQSDTVALLRGAPGSDRPTAARLGGDEFAVLLENAGDQAALERVAERLLDVLREPVTLHDKTFVPTTSIGVAAFPEDGTTQEALLASADAAMYRAKRRGRDTYELGSGREESIGAERDSQPPQNP